MRVAPLAVCVAVAAAAVIGAGAEVSAVGRTGHKLQLRQRHRARRTTAKSQAARAVSKARALAKGVNPLSPNDDIKFLMTLLERFHSFAVEGNEQVDMRHLQESAETHAAIQAANTTATQLALTQASAIDAESLVETKKVLTSVKDFTTTLETALGAAYEGSKGCANLVCGKHASCTETTLGGQCICDEGYIGNGRDCHAPDSFIPHKLLVEGQSGMSTHVAELHVAVFMGTKVVAAWRDITNGNIGRVIVGHTTPGDVIWTTPERFSATATSKAFAPQVVGLPSNRIAVVYRDAARGGACWLRGAEVGISGLRGASSHLTWGEPLTFCQGQSHNMAILSLASSKVAVFFADRTAATATAEEEIFGNALLAGIEANGGVSMAGKTRFIDRPVVRIETIQVSPSSFAIGVRASKKVDEMNTELVTRQEALAIFGEMVDGDLVFDPNMLALEPKEEQIWARGMSLIAPDTFGYAYQLGREKELRLDVIHVDPKTHRMKIVTGPHLVAKGLSPYVSMLNYPYAPTDSHTFVYYEKKKETMINVCRWRPAEAGHHAGLQHCEDFTFTKQPVNSMAGVTLTGGRALFLFTTEDKVPYWQVLGVSKK